VNRGITHDEWRGQKLGKELVNAGKKRNQALDAGTVGDPFLLEGQGEGHEHRTQAIKLQGKPPEQNTYQKGGRNWETLAFAPCRVEGSRGLRG